MKAIYSTLERGAVRVYLTNVISANETNMFDKNMYFIQEIEGKGFWQEEITMQEAKLLLGHELNKETADGSVGVNSHMCFLKEAKIDNPKNNSKTENAFIFAAFILASQKLAEIEKTIITSNFDETAQLISELLQPETENFKRLINYFISDYQIVLVAVYELLHNRRKFVNENKFSTKGHEILAKQEEFVNYFEAI